MISAPPDIVVGLQIAPGSRLEMKSCECVRILTRGGIVGDRYENSKHRHVSVQAVGELSSAEADFGAHIDRLGTRRNITISGVDVPRNPGHRWTIGPVELEVVRDAAPCRMLDEELGDGARTAMRRRAGVICRVIRGGEVCLGAVVDRHPLTD